MSENSDEPPVNKQEETIHHFYMMNKLLVCSYSKLKNPEVYYPAILYSIHSHYCVFKE